MALTSLTDYRNWLNGSNERAPEVPAAPPEIMPVDTVEPYIDSRAELVLAADDLCLAAYALMDAKSEDLTGKQPGVYVLRLEGYQNGRYINEVDQIQYWEITDVKIGSDEPIPTPWLDESVLPESTLETIRQELLDPYTAAYMTEIEMNDRRMSTQRNALSELTANARTFIAATLTGLAVVTEAFDKIENDWKVIRFEQDSVNPDDIFAPSDEQAEHQEHYRELMQVMMQRFGEYLPQAPDRREVVGMVLGDVALDGSVDISNITIFPATLDKIKATIGKPHGLAWPLFTRERVAAEADAFYESPLGEGIEAESTYDDISPENAYEQITIPERNNPEMLDELDTLRFKICTAAFDLMRLYGLEQNEPFGLGVPYDEGDTRYIFHHNMFEGYGERATIAKITSNGYKEYDIFAIEKYPGALGRKGKPITLKNGPSLLHALQAMVAKAKNDRRIVWGSNQQQPYPPMTNW